MKSVRLFLLTAAAFQLSTFILPSAFSQGYYVDSTHVLPVARFTAEPTPLSLSLAREDVKSIGMGRSQVANTRLRNAMNVNPAFLASKRYSVDVLNLQVGIPGQTLTATNFIKGNQKQFAEGIFLKEIKAGLDDFQNALTPAQYQAAIDRMNNGLSFITDLINDVSGGEANPMTHGLRVIPAVQAQFGNFGFSIMSVAQTGFQVSSGRALEELKGFRVPQDLSDPTAIAQAIQTLLLTVDALFDSNGDIALDALPTVTALSFVDIIGSAGYGMQLSREFSAGINLKIINRRFSTSRIPAQKLQDLFSETLASFNTSVTGVTVDAGLLYTLPASGTRLALTAENIFPIKKIQSDVDITVVETFIEDYARTSPGGAIKIQNGDTGLVAARLPIQLIIPFDLKAPLILTAGAQHSITPDWDVAAEWTDIASQSSLYDKFLQRIRIGTEYRLRPIGNAVGLAIRLGLAQEHLTAGVGLDVFKFVQLDGAVAFDRFTDATSYYAQLRIGW